MSKARPPLPPGPYLIVGLARSGLAAALALRARAQEVIGCDSGSPDRAGLIETARRLSEAGAEIHLDASGDALAARAGTLIKSPGVPQNAPAVLAARRAGISVLGELELAWRLIPNQFVAVTGTNGKTTTTQWIAHIHRQAGLPVAVAGNVGTAASSLVDRLDREVTVVCEASSFQLEDTEAFAPEEAVLINISPDHLDRHRSFDDYVAAKLRIFANQGEGDTAVLPDSVSLSHPGRVIRFGHGPEAALSKQISLPGAHNRENAMAAAAACLARGIDVEAVRDGLRTFAGVKHRLERIAVIDGVAWINDSKATNVASTLVALQAIPGGIHLIAGGRGKNQRFSALVPLVASRCRTVYLVGEAAEEIAVALEGAAVPLVRVGDLEHAVATARSAARSGETVLLSPACASFDQYRDFEARGEHFRKLVGAMAVGRTR